MDPDDHQTVESEPSADVAAAVLRVANLERTLQFYCDVFSCRVAIREADMALLLTPNNFELYVHERSEYVSRGGVGNFGTQHLMWATDNQSEMQRITERLSAYDTSAYSHNVDGMTVLEGRDPDGCRVIVGYPSPRRVPRAVIAERLRG
jgi:catechol-2,3-dioxygenase